MHLRFGELITGGVNPLTAMAFRLGKGVYFAWEASKRVDGFHRESVDHESFLNLLRDFIILQTSEWKISKIQALLQPLCFYWPAYYGYVCFVRSQIGYIPLISRVQGPYSKLWTEFFSFLLWPKHKAHRPWKQGRKKRGSITCHKDRANEANKMFIIWLCWLFQFWKVIES